MNAAGPIPELEVAHIREIIKALSLRVDMLEARVAAKQRSIALMQMHDHYSPAEKARALPRLTAEIDELVYTLRLLVESLSFFEAQL